MQEVLVNHIGGLSLPRKSVVRLTDCTIMTIDVFHGHKTATQQQQKKQSDHCLLFCHSDSMDPLYNDYNDSICLQVF